MAESRLKLTGKIVLSKDQFYKTFFQIFTQILGFFGLDYFDFVQFCSIWLNFPQLG
jgi:hypothetical protein